MNSISLEIKNSVEVMVKAFTINKMGPLWGQECCIIKEEYKI